jgi:16S rRNA (guanine(966)-N(2))-methyltransferase RsmD
MNFLLGLFANESGPTYRLAGMWRCGSSLFRALEANEHRCNWDEGRGRDDDCPMATGHKKPRIIAGEAGGRRLAVPPGDGVRPTSDRVKESVFSALGPGRLVGARVLDLYAGSGALGLEALSRGAAAALLVERDAAAARAIRANIVSLGFEERATLRVATVAAVLGGPGPAATFDLVLLDPPYDTPASEVEGALRLLGAEAWTASDATVVVERAAGSPPVEWPEGWGSTWERCYGDTLVLFAQRK